MICILHIFMYSVFPKYFLILSVINSTQHYETLSLISHKLRHIDSLIYSLMQGHGDQFSIIIMLCTEKSFNSQENSSQNSINSLTPGITCTKNYDLRLISNTGKLMINMLYGAIHENFFPKIIKFCDPPTSYLKFTVKFSWLYISYYPLKPSAMFLSLSLIRWKVSQLLSIP